jgi:putrescine importer
MYSNMGVESLPEPATAKTELKRVLSRRGLILYGLVILTPTAAYPVFGIVQQASKGHATFCYLIAMVAMMFTAASYGKMSSAFPSAGSTYSYVQNSLNQHVGFLAGWSMILDYLLIPLLSVVYASLTATHMVPRVPYAVWAVVFSVVITWINVRGIQVTAAAGNGMMVLMTICAVVFVVLTAHWVLVRHGVAGLMPRPPFHDATLSLRPLMLGAAIASLSYIGFDAISTLAEETLHPERDISFATVAVCIIETVFCVVTVFLAARVWPDYRTFPDPATAILDVARLAGGTWMLAFISVILLVAGLASALNGQAGASRLLLGMGRDGVISRSFFAHVDPRYATPDRGIYLMGCVSLVGALVLHFDLIVELLNFGAFIGFILVNLSVIRHFYLRLKQRSGMALVTNLIFPLAGATFCCYIWMNLSSKAQIAGFAWLGLGVAYLAVLTRGFRLPPVRLSSLSAEGNIK